MTTTPLSTAADDARSLLPTRAALAAQVAATNMAADDTTPDTAAVLEAAGGTDAGTVSEVQAFDLDALAESLSDRLGGQLGRPAPHALSAYSSLSEFVAAARAGDQAALQAFAIADQVTGDNPGVVPPGWLTDVKGIINRGQRAIEAFGGSAGLPDSGMDVVWPYFDGDLSTIVGAQAAEKTEVTSVKVSLKKGTAGLATFAGGSDVSWQLIQRSSPSYQDAYLRILAAAYAMVTDRRFVADIFAVANTVDAAPIVLDLVAGATTADKVREAFFQASVRVDAATGAPANAALAATDVFVAIGGKAGIYPAPYGTQNASGTADAASLRVEVSGLTVTHCPSLPNGAAVLGNDLAARWHGTGALFASADDVLKLGTDTVVWGMGATGVYAPAGVVGIVKTAPTRAGA